MIKIESKNAKVSSYQSGKTCGDLGIGFLDDEGKDLIDSKYLKETLFCPETPCIPVYALFNFRERQRQRQG